MSSIAIEVPKEMTQARELLELHLRDVAKCLQANSEGKVAMTFDVLRDDTDGRNGS
jgi:hypothetical protein